jgi:type I restriction enzyme R subunit
METHIGKTERTSQNRIIELFQSELGYEYLGNWEDGVRTQPIEENLMQELLTRKTRLV